MPMARKWDARKALTVPESHSPNTTTPRIDLDSTELGTIQPTAPRVLDISERKHPEAKCEECPLYSAGKYVPSKFPNNLDGNNREAQSTIAFIGEAPARNEIRLGEPFVGASGQLLNAVLQNYGIRRDSVLLTNACGCHYPSSMKNLPIAAIEACRPRLLSDLSEAGVSTAVVMGNSAVKAILPPSEARKGITKLRAGPPRKGVKELPNLSIVPTFHPAACLRNQAQFPLMLSDVGKAINSKSMQWYEPSVIVVTDPTDALWQIQGLLERNRDTGVVVDTESGRDKDTSFGRDDGPYGRILCIGIGGTHPDDQDEVIVFDVECLADLHVRQSMRNMLNKCGSIMQNGKYDVGVLMNFLDQETPFPLLADTMLMSYSLYEVGGVHGLKYMGKELLGTPEWEDEIKPYITKDQGYATIPKDMLHRYNAFDVHVTRMVYDYFFALIQQQGLEDLNKFLLRVSFMLTMVETRGLGFDLETSKSIETELDIELTQRKEQIPINPNSPKQVKDYLAEFGIITDSTDEEHCITLMEKSDIEVPPHVKHTLRQILDFRGFAKLKGTYVTGLQKRLTERGTIHPSFLIHGTNTGRLSSRGPNSQNIPRTGPIKKQFVAHDPKSVMIETDYSQAELRVLTWLAGEDTMRDLFNDPTRDVFIELCRSMFPDTFDDMDAEAKGELRTLIKTFAYGIAYNRTAAGIAGDSAFNMSVVVADKHMKSFQGMIPNIMAYQRGILAKIHRGEDLINPFGRHRRFHLITDMNKTNVENEASAFMPQSTASDICLEAACRLTKEGIYIVNMVHDAIYSEGTPDEVDDIVKLTRSTMLAVADEITGGYVDFDTDSKVGYRWGDMQKYSSPYLVTV